MKFSIDKHEKYVLFKLNESKLDSITSPALKSELIMINANGIRNIILQLSDVKLCDSKGLSALLVANRLCTNSDGIFVLTGLQPTVEKVLQISHLEDVFNIVNSASEAIDLIFMEEIEKDLKRELDN